MNVVLFVTVNIIELIQKYYSIGFLLKINSFWTKKKKKKEKQREGTWPPLCRFSTVTPLWPLVWLFIINGSGLWGNAKSSCSLPGCRMLRGGRGDFLCVYVTEGRKWGEKGVIKSAQKNCQRLSSSREIYYRPKLLGNQRYPFAVSRDHTPPLLGKAAHSPLESTGVSEHSLNRTQAKCTSKHKEPEAICAAASRRHTALSSC